MVYGWPGGRHRRPSRRGPPARPAGATGHEDAGSGSVVRLPATYVAEYVKPGYATTTARSQGITVDESHTIASTGMGREDLYVAVTRGHDTNRTYVVVDERDDCVPARARAAGA